MKRFASLVFAALALGGCKSESAKAPEPMAQFMAGYWKPVHKRATCDNGAFRFDRQQVFIRQKRVDLPAFHVEKAAFRGRSLELTLKLSDTAKILGFRANRDPKLVDSATVYLSLHVGDERIEMNDIQLEDSRRGIVAPRPHEVQSARQMFTMERCVA